MAIEYEKRQKEKEIIMIRSFADKMKVKQKAYEAEQKVLAEQAEQARIKKEWQDFDQEQELKAVETRQILAEDKVRKSQEYLEWKKEFRAKQLQEQEEEKNKTVDTGLPLNHQGAWQLDWQTFIRRTNIKDLPMSEKIRRFKIEQQRQLDVINYYAHMFGSTSPGQQPGTPVAGDSLPVGNFITETTTITDGETLSFPSGLKTSAEVTINIGGTLDVTGTLQLLEPIIVYGTLQVEGVILNEDLIQLFGDGELIVNS
tara:strand:+ start:602 stop:1372 length:771 start_codon:yes stop_codon:yes gene_type:complete